MAESETDSIKVYPRNVGKLIRWAAKDLRAGNPTTALDTLGLAVVGVLKDQRKIDPDLELDLRAMVILGRKLLETQSGGKVDLPAKAMRKDEGTRLGEFIRALKSINAIGGLVTTNWDEAYRFDVLHRQRALDYLADELDFRGRRFSLIPPGSKRARLLQSAKGAALYILGLVTPALADLIAAAT